MTATTVRLTGAQVLVRLLQAEGVQHAFGIVGGKLAPLLQALARHLLEKKAANRAASAEEVIERLARPLADRLAFPLREHPQHIHDQSARCRAGINRLADREQAESVPDEILLDQHVEIAQGARQPIELADDKRVRISLLKHLQRRLQAWPSKTLPR